MHFEIIILELSNYLQGLPRMPFLAASASAYNYTTLQIALKNFTPNWKCHTEYGTQVNPDVKPHKAD